MSLPPPPEDLETRNIIDKLASFVARNGQDFETMTRQKQQNNPKFQFLNGGEHHLYYLYKIQAEQALLRQQQPPPSQQQPFPMPMPNMHGGSNQGIMPSINSMNMNVGQRPPHPHFAGSGPNPAWPPPRLPLFQGPPSQIPIPPGIAMEQAFQQQIQSCQERMRQSETNLLAQKEMLQINKKSKIQETIRAARQARIQAQAAEAKIDLKELDRVTSSIIESCTKDNITSGKNFIFTHNQTSLQTDTICLYLVDRLLSPDASFDARLHLIYLINDILHNCVRKGYDELRLHLEKIIVPTFCLAVDQADEERKGKLVKLLDLWEKNKYFRVEIMEKLRDINQARIHYEEAIKIEYAPIIDPIEANFEGKYHQLERQHQDFIQHTQTQLVQISHMQQSHQQQQQFASSLPPHIPQTPQLPPNMFPPPPNMVGPNGAQQFGPQQGNNIRGPPLNNRMLSPSIPSTSLQPPPLMSLNPFNDNGRDSLPPQTSSNVMNPQGPCLPPMPNPNLISQQMFEQVPSLMSINTYQPPSSNDSNDEYSSNENSQDGSLSNNVSSQISELTPEVPYYDLPAGLMCPLVKDDDCDYRSLDPHLIRLPPPQVPTERLLAAINNFYSAATHDSPRNAEGWERLGLFEFYKMKNKYKYSKERIQRIAKEQQDALKPPGRQRKSVSSTSSSSSSRSTSSDLSDDQGQKRRRSRSRSESPRAHHHHQTHSIVTLPRPKSRSKTKSRSRSVSPPTFTSAPVGIGTINPKAQHHHTTQKLDESNIGHKLLQKMGWKGKGGLGLKGQGIAEPIAAGAEVRERNELYKGIGVEEDPFEQFRKNKSKGYVNRLISARATTTTKRKPKDGEEDDEDEDEQQQQQEGSGDIFATT